MPPQRTWIVLLWLGLALAVGCTASHVVPEPASEWQLSAGQPMVKPSQSPLPQVYVANYGNDRVLQFRLSANGDIPPKRSLGGPKTQITALTSIGVDDADLIYAPLTPSKQYPIRVGVFTPNQIGDVAPIRIIIDAYTLHQPLLIAVDPTGTVYILYTDAKHNQGIDEFPPGANGILTPVHEIMGSKTLLSGAQTIVGLVADDSGGIWWICNGATGIPRVVGYAPGAHGDVAPTIVLGANAKTKIKAPSRLSVDENGYVYVQTPFGVHKDGVLVFSPGATGDVPPIRKTQFNGDFQLGAVYAGFLVATGVVNSDEYAIGTFDSHKSGIQDPRDVIAGSKTHLDEPIETVFR
jgi:hypothetical protein